jgi:hypothetical protein
MVGLFALVLKPATAMFFPRETFATIAGMILGGRFIHCFGSKQHGTLELRRKRTAAAYDRKLHHLHHASEREYASV